MRTWSQDMHGDGVQHWHLWKQTIFMGLVLGYGVNMIRVGGHAIFSNGSFRDINQRILGMSCMARGCPESCGKCCERQKDNEANL